MIAKTTGVKTAMEVERLKLEKENTLFVLVLYSAFVVAQQTCNKPLPTKTDHAQKQPAKPGKMPHQYQLLPMKKPPKSVGKTGRLFYLYLYSALKISYLCAINKTANKFLHNKRATNAVLALNLCCNQGRPNARKNTLTRMDRLVRFTVLGKDFEARIKGAATEQEAREIATTQIAKEIHQTFRIKWIVPDVQPQTGKPSIWDLCKSGFKTDATSR